MFIYRKGYYDEEQNQTTSNERQSAELILAKNRAGATEL